MRGKGDLNQSGSSNAPLRQGNTSIALRLAHLAQNMQARADKLEEIANEKRERKETWQTLKQEGVSLPDRLLVRLRDKFETTQSEQQAKQERFTVLRQEAMANIQRAKSEYMERGMEQASPLDYAWDAASIYKAPWQAPDVQESNVWQTQEAVPAPTEKPVVIAKIVPDQKPAKVQVKVAPQSKPRAPEYGPAPSEIAGIAMPDSVPHKLDEELKEKIPTHEAGASKETWDNWSQWLGEFENWKDYDNYSRKENTFHRREMAVLLGNYLRSGENPSPRDLVEIMGMMGVSQPNSAALYMKIQDEPETFQRALEHLSPNSEAPLHQRIDSFCKELGTVRAAFYSPRGDKGANIDYRSGEGKLSEGGKLALASAFLFALNGPQTPVFRHAMTMDAYKGLDIPKPSKNMTSGQKYVHFLGLLDKVNEEMATRGNRSQDRLAAWEAMLWTLDGPKWYERSLKGQSAFPNWDNNQIKEYMRWHRTFTKKTVKAKT